MSIAALSTGRLHTAIAAKSTSLAIELIGTADLEARQAFYTWVHEVHEEAMATQCESVQVNLHQLEFMSSMCVNVLVGWLVAIMEMPHKQQYSVELLWDKRQLWQRRSVHALQRFAPRIVQTEP